MRRIILLTVLLLSAIGGIQAQDNVGIGTLAPNPNALVDMEANDKGLLIPRLTTAERLAIPTAGLADEALLVYDTTLDFFFYWNGAAWIGFPLDNDPTNELQDFTADADSIYLSDGNAISLGDLVTTNIYNDTTLVINGDTVILPINPGGIDTDDQTLTLVGDQLTIADGNTVTLTDIDATNELQDLGINGDSITINGGTSISINDISNTTVLGDTALVINGDTIDLNDLTTTNVYNDTTLVINGDTVIINGSGGVNTDDQNLTLSNDTLFIEDGNFVVLPTGVITTDDQVISVVGDTLFLEDGGSIFLGDLTNITNLGDTSLVLNGDTIAFPADADTDPTNELQDLAVVGDSLIINGGTNVYLGDLTNVINLGDTSIVINGDTLTTSGFGTDDQNLTGATLSGTTLTIDIENGSSTSVDLGSLATGIDSIYSSSDSLFVVASGDTAIVDLGGLSDTDDQTLSLNNDTLFIDDGNFVVLSDIDATNELQDLGINGDSITINGGTSISINDISNTTVLGDAALVINGDTIDLSDLTTTNVYNDTTLVINGDTVIINGSGGVNTDDQNLTLSNDTLFIEDGNFVVLPTGVITTDDQVISVVGDTLFLEDGGSIFLGDLTNITNLGDTSLVLNGDTIAFPADADTDPTNELQNLGVVGDSLIINGGTNVYLGDLTSVINLGDTSIVINGDTLTTSGFGTDDQNLTGATLSGTTLTIDIENGSSTSVDLGSLATGIDSIYSSSDSLFVVASGDTAIVDLGGLSDTDDQTLSLNNDTLFIDDGNFVVLSDIDATNELQDLGINGDSITINGGTSISINDISNTTVLGDTALVINGDTIDLSDLTTTNVYNDTTLVINGDTVIINGSGGINTDDQNLTLSNDTLFIEDGNFVVLPSGVITTDDQVISVVGDTLFLEDGGSIFLGDLTNITNLGDTSLVLNGDTIAFPNDADIDPTNELQDLGINGDSLTINGGNSISINDLSTSVMLGDTAIVINGDTLNLTSVGTDDQNLTGATLLGSTLTIDIEDGNSVSVDLGSLAAGLDSIYGTGDSLIFVSNGGVDTAYIDLGSFTDTDDQTLTLVGDQLTIADGNTVTLTDIDATNELQDLGVVGDSLVINGGTNVYLGDITNITNLGDTSLVLNGDTISFPADADTDPTNELQDLGINGDSITINGGTSISINDISNTTVLGDTALVFNGDTIDLSDLTSTNVYNDTTLVINGDTVIINGSGGINTDDQNLTLSNDTLFIEDGNFVVLPSGVVNTDDQVITVLGDTLFLEDGGSIFLGDLTNITNLGDTSLVLNGDTIAFPADADTDPTNELQDLAVVGDSLIINGGTNVYLGDLTSVINLGDTSIVINGDTLTTSGFGTDDQNLTGATLAGSTLTIDIEDGNSVSVDLGSLAAGLDSIYGQGDSLIFVSNGGVDTAYINLGGFADTDDQTLTLVGDQLTIADGNTVTLNDIDATNELQDLGVVGDSLTINGGTNVYLGDLTNITNLGDTSLVLNGDTISFPADADTDPTNELQDLGINGDSITINGGTSISINDLSSTTFLGDTSLVINGDTISLGDLITTNLYNDTTLVINGDTVIINGSGGIDTDDQNLTLSNDTLFIEDGNFVVLPSGVVNTDDQVITVLGDTLFLEDGGAIFLGDLTNITNLGDTSLVLNGDTIAFPADADTDPTNELQALSFDTDSIYLSDGNAISINDFSSTTIINDTTLIVNGDTVTLPSGSGGIDTDDQTLTLIGDQLTIVDGNTVTLTDIDATNELQDLGINGDSLTINGGTSISINDLSSSVMLGDTAIVINGDTLNLTGVGTDDQDLTAATLSGTTLTIDIENGNSVNVDLGSLAAGLDSIYGQGDSLILVSNGGADTAYVNLGGFADTDDQTLTLVGDQLTIIDGNTVTLTDVDATNELQDLSFDADSIYISNGTAISITDVAITGPQGPAGPAGADGVDGTNGTNGLDGADGTNGTNGIDGADGADGAAGPQGPVGPQGPQGDPATDDQNLTAATLVGTTLTIDIENGNSVNVDLGSLAAGLDSIYGQGDSLILVSNGGADTAYVNLGGFADTDDQTLTLVGDQLAIADGNTITLTDVDPTNELQDLSFDADSIYISNGTAISITDVAITGPQGPAGPAGADGVDGTNGTNGLDGADGADGTNGTNGIDGADGADGAAGPQGPIGLTGPAGADGADGVDGTNGTNGLDGADGADGTNGTDGIDGADGAAGPQGPVGPQGPQGDPATDDQNLTAATLSGTTLTIDIENGSSVNVDLGSLAAGLDSIYGQGDSLILISNGGTDTAFVDLGGFADTDDQTLSLVGDQLTIADGNTITLTDVDPTNELQDLSFDADSIYISNGDAISITDVAINGPAGPQGPIGLTGPAGADGADGVDGTNGTNGTDGVDGADGAVGPQGPIGLTGPAGADGADGVDGTNGTNGTDGVDGADGMDGAVGPQGPPGNPATDDQMLSILGDQLTISGGNTVTVPTYDGTDFALSNQTCPVGQVATGFTAAGVVICSPAASGDITSVAAGAGLTGGGVTGAVILDATANNGLNVDVVADAIQLGGPLIENTTISQGNFNLEHNLNGTGEFQISDGITTVFEVRPNGNTYTGRDVFFNDNGVAGTTLVSITDDVNDGRLIVNENGLPQIDLDANNGSIFNQQGLDRNFRIESNNAPNMFFIDGGIDRIGIGTGLPTNLVHINDGNIDPLRIGNLANDATLTNVMVTDGFGVVHIRDASTLGGTNFWSLTGNAGTNPATNFLGTTDNQALSFRLNNTWAGRWDHNADNYFIGANNGLNTTPGTGTTGQHNNAMGSNALQLNTSGSYNLAIGSFALNANINGNNNVGIGSSALMSNSSGDRNVAISSSTLTSNTVGSDNVAIGSFVLNSNTDGSYNIGIGQNALRFNTSGTENIAFGRRAMYDNTTGDYNVAMGPESLTNNTTGYGNVAIGRYSLRDNTTGFNNQAIGNQALESITTGTWNTGIGLSTMYDNTTGSNNVAIGNLSHGNNATGDNNVAIGVRAGNRDISGNDNVYLGFEAGGMNSIPPTFTRSRNVFIGYQAGRNETGSNRLYIESTSSATPLIYGEFDNNLVKINGDLGVGSVVGAPSNGLHVNTGAADPVRIENLATDATLTNVMVTDNNGVVHVRDASTIGGAVTANNGLNVDAGVVQLGGPLVEETTITTDVNNIRFNVNNAAAQFQVQGNGVDKFVMGLGGNATLAGDLYFRDVTTAGTLIGALTDDANDGRFRIYENGAVSVDLDANTQFVFNEQGLDRNFRVESNGDANMLYVDAGLNRVGIGEAIPLNTLHVDAVFDPLRLEGLVTDNTLDEILVQDNFGVVHSRDLSSISGWSLIGNGGTNPTTNFLGTTDNQDLVFRTNNVENMRINTNGNVGIGTTNAGARLYTLTPATDATTNYGIYNGFFGTDVGNTYAMRNFNNSTSNGGKYGIYNSVSNAGTGLRYGIYNVTANNAGSNAAFYGINNTSSSYGTAAQYGLYNLLNAYGTANGVRYASYNNMNTITSSNTATKYGEYTTVDLSNGDSYGEYKQMNSNATYSAGDIYGDYSLLQGTGNNLKQAYTADIPDAGTGTHIGYYANVPGGIGDYAARFEAGNVVMNESGNNYDVRIESLNRPSMFMVDASDDVVRIGTTSGGGLAEQGNTRTVAGQTFTLSYVANMEIAAGNAGTVVGIGSTECFIDAGNLITMFHGRLIPYEDNTRSLGEAAYRWQSLWAADGTINTSDVDLKDNIKPLAYGLEELMNIETITFNWKDSPNKNTKIGFSAQNLNEVIPEVVVTTDEYVIDEETKETETRDIDNWGVYYSDIIPVTVKAIQEQQVMIEELQNNTNVDTEELSKEVESIQEENEKLKEENEALKTRLDNIELMLEQLLENQTEKE